MIRTILLCCGLLFPLVATAAPTAWLQQGQLPARWTLKETVVCLSGNCRNGDGIEWRWREHHHPEERWQLKGPVLISYGTFKNSQLNGPGRIISFVPDDAMVRERQGFMKAKPTPALKATLQNPTIQGLEQQLGTFRWLEATFADGEAQGDGVLIARTAGKRKHEGVQQSRTEGTLIKGHFHGMARQWSGYEANPETMMYGGLRYGLRHGFWHERAGTGEKPDAWIYRYYLAGNPHEVPWSIRPDGAYSANTLISAFAGIDTLSVLTLDDGSFYFGQSTPEGIPDGFGMRVAEDGSLEETGVFRRGLLDGQGHRTQWLDTPWLRFDTEGKDANPVLNYYLQHVRLEKGQFKDGKLIRSGTSNHGGLSYRLNWTGLYETTAYGRSSEVFQHEREGHITWLSKQSLNSDGKETLTLSEFTQATPYGGKASVMYLTKPSNGAIPPAYAGIWARMKADDERRANLPHVKEARERALASAFRANQEKAARDEARRRNNTSSGPSRPEFDQRKLEQKLNDKIYWDNYKRCGFGKC